MRSQMSIFIITAVCAALLGGAVAMADDLVLASAIEGRVVDTSGKPASGLTITRSVGWDGKTNTTSVTTDANGRFAFPNQPPTKRIGFFQRKMNTSVLVQVTADTGSGEVMLAQYRKPSLKPNSESPQNVPLYFECTTEVGVEGDSFPFGTCRLVSAPPS